VTYQAVLRNPLAEPYLLGVSGGASLTAYLAAVSTGTLASICAARPAVGRVYRRAYSR